MWLFKVARPGFWLTSIWFYLLPVGGRAVWNCWTFWLGLLYVTFPLGLLIYGWNDLFDAENDRRNPRKDTFLFGARPTSAQLAILPGWIAIVQCPFALCFLLIVGLKTLPWWAAVGGATALYNLPRIGFKNWPIVDLLNQISYVLVFVLSSWLNALPQAPWFTFAFGALFAMHSHLFGEVMDHGVDLIAGRRTTAGAFGVIPAKWLLAALLVVESGIVWWFAGDPWIAAALLAGSLFFICDATLIWRNRPYAGWQMRFFFLGWNAAALFSIPWVWWTARLASPLGK